MSRELDELADDIEVLEDDVFDEMDGAPLAEARPAPKVRAGGWFHFFLGTLLVGGAAALVFAPEFSWRLTKIGRQLAEYGVETATLVLAGLIFFGLGFVTRSARKAAAQVARSIPQTNNSSDSDFLLVADQLATDLSQVLTSVLQITADIQGVSESQRTLAHQITQQEEPSQDDHNAIFRLAASMDKLNAHIDERLHGFDVQFRSRFESVSNAIHETRMALEARLDSVAGAPAPMAPAPASPADMEFGLAATPEPSMDFFDQIEAQEGPASLPVEPQLDAPSPALPSQPDPLDALLPDDAIQRAIDPDGLNLG